MIIISVNYLDLFIRYKKDTKTIPGKQQGILEKRWNIKSKTADMLYETNDRLFSFMIARHPFERLLSAYRLRHLKMNNVLINNHILSEISSF